MTITAKTLTGLMIVVACMLSACSDDDAPALRLGTNLWPGYEPLYLARDMGFIDKNEIRLVEYVSNSEVIRGFVNRNIDAAALTLDEALLVKQRGLDIRIILVTDISHGGDAIIGRTNDQTLADLKGKRIGVEGSALGAYFITRALKESGLALDDVHIENLHVNEHEAAFLSGQVDAVVTFEPVRTSLLHKGGKELFTSRQIPGEIVDVIVVTEDAVSRQAGHISSLVNGWFRALDYLQASPMAAAKIIDLRQKIGPQKVIESYEGMKMPDRQENIRFLLGETATLKVVADQLQRVMLSQELLSAPIDVDDLFGHDISGLKGG